MPREAKGIWRLEVEEDRHKVVPATDTQPTPTAKGVLERSAVTSNAGMWKDRVAHQAIAYLPDRPGVGVLTLRTQQLTNQCLVIPFILANL